MYSMWSSMEMMCPAEFLLRWPIMAASEVDLPGAGGADEDHQQPRLVMASFLMISGRRSCSTVGY